MTGAPVSFFGMMSRIALKRVVPFIAIDSRILQQSMRWDENGEQKYGVVGVYLARSAQWDPQVRSDNW